MSKPSNKKEELCLKCLKCCKELWIHTAFANDCIGAIEFFKARGMDVQKSDRGILVIKLKSPCQHLTDKGCAIYENRPYVCKLYDGRPDHSDCKWHDL